MCQEQNVVAIATLTPKGGKIVYKKANGGIGEKKITIKQNPNNSDYYGGSLELNSDLTAVLNGSHLEMLKPPLF